MILALVVVEKNIKSAALIKKLLLCLQCLIWILIVSHQTIWLIKKEKTKRT